MPIYEYICEGCGNTFEQFHPVREEKVSCPVCHGSVRKLMSRFSVEVPDEACAKLPRGEERELCSECKQGGSACPYTA